MQKLLNLNGDLNLTKDRLDKEFSKKEATLHRADPQSKLKGKTCRGYSYDNYHTNRFCEVNSKQFKMDITNPTFVLLKNTTAGQFNYQSWCLIVCTMKEKDDTIFGNASDEVFSKLTNNPNRNNLRVHFSEKTYNKDEIKNMFPTEAKEIDDAINEAYPIE